MININVSMDTTAVKRMTRLMHADQIPFASSVAINEVAKAFQAKQTAHMNRAFNVRRPAFVNRAVKIKPFATKRLRVATVMIEPPGGKARADVLSKFEEGGIKRARGGGSIALPQDVKIGSRSSYDRNKPTAFNFQLRGSGPSGQVFVGDRGTFMIRKPGGKGAIFQRTGTASSATFDRDRGTGGRFTGIATRTSGRMSRSKTKLLYTFARSARIDSRLDFIENVTEVVRTSWAREFEKAWARAVRTSR